MAPSRLRKFSFPAMTSDPSDRTASIHLDYDADCAPFDFASLHICERGMRLRTRWFFEAGTELSVNFQMTDPGGGTAAGSRASRILRTEGYVVDCQPACGGTGGYEVTVAFWEVTDDILAAIRDLVPSAALHE